MSAGSNHFGGNMPGEGSPLMFKRKHSEGTASAASAIINLSKTILGASMLALPNAFQVGGYITGAILLTVGACAAMFGLDLLATCARASDAQRRQSSYGAVALASVPAATVIIDAAVAIKCFGVGISYLVVVGDLLPDVMKQLVSGGILCERATWVVLTGVFVLLPLASLRRLDSLRRFSLAGNVSALYLVVVVVACSVLEGYNPCNQVPLPPSIVDQCMSHLEPFVPTWGILKILSVFIFGYTCHQNIFTIHNELIDNGKRNIRYVILTSIIICASVYVILLSGALITFGPLIDHDLLKMYPMNAPVLVCRLALSLMVIASFPLQSHPCRDSVMHLLEVARPESNWRENRTLYWGLTTGIVTTSMCIALVVKNLSTVLAVVGGTASTTLTLILPGLFYVKMFPEEGWSVRRSAAAVLCAAGVIIMPLSLAVSLKIIKV